ncbi:flavin reductase family protein [Flammeovirga sp. SubArs3]|uniref:flavin reductase family protein n=1 Tax=Flammeovirga sp. SubArs3 TaxID=2995316 RepID=UPI00248D176D|nr:flavin reductase family protein [Flammeovirga sp. SubArs3]
MIDSALFKAAMRRITSTVTIVTSEGISGKEGLTATAVTSLSDTPPSLLVCVNKQSKAHDVILRNKTFSIHLLNEHQETVSNTFAGYTDRQGDDKFSIVEWADQGQYKSMEGALATIHCKLIEAHNGFTHNILIGEITEITLSDENDKPLLYGNGKYTSIK